MHHEEVDWMQALPSKIALSGSHMLIDEPLASKISYKRNLALAPWLSPDVSGINDQIIFLICAQPINLQGSVILYRAYRLS